AALPADLSTRPGCVAEALRDPHLDFDAGCGDPFHFRNRNLTLMAKDIVMKRFLLLITVGLGLLAPADAQKADVILTTDCGTDVDDQWMIVYLLLSPEFNVKGIVTTHAPNLAVPQAETSANCVRDVVKRLGIPAPPIFAGSSTSLKDRTPLRNDGVDFMVKTARQYSATHRLAIFTIGAATDVGSAFLADPGLENRVEILSMGFN